VRWKIEESERDPLLVLHWRESGVNPPPVTRRGFGSELLERLVPQTLGGTAHLKMHSDGIECVIQFPLLDDQDCRDTPKDIEAPREHASEV
jgi:two-component system CheB/CheR fusion protein